MFRAIFRLLGSDQGQDLAEYCLLTALVALIALGIFYRAAGGIDGIWGAANTTLASGNSTVPAAGGIGTARSTGN